MIKNYLKLLVALVFATNVMAQNIPSYVPKDGLVGWWPFNGNANDESGNENHGTVNGATLSSDRNGKANSAYSFEGNQWIEVANSKSIQPIDAFTLSAWVLVEPTQPSLNDNYTRIISKNQAEPQNFATYQLITGLNTEYGKTGVCIRTGSGLSGNGEGVYNWTGPYSMNILKTYQHVVGTYNGSKLSFFQNGKLMNTVKHSGKLFYDDGKLWFGRGLGSTTDSKPIDSFFNGQLDDIAIYNRALSDQEVKQLYEGCPKETATSSNFNSYVFSNNSSVNLTATPTGGTFSGEAVTNNAFNPSKAKLGKNKVKYTFKNSTGCADSTNFEMILVDTLGNKCTETIYDTVKVKESTYDTLKIKVQLTTGIKAGQIATMNVYPNPTSDVVIIEANDVAALNGYSYKMVDLQGKQVYKELVTTSKTEISLKSIGAKGVYILHIVDAQGVSIENKKIVLE